MFLQDLLVIDDGAPYSDDAGGIQMARVEKKENILEKSFGKLKETGTVCFSLVAFLSWKDCLSFIWLMNSFASWH